MKLRSVDASLGLPGVTIGGTWDVDETQQQAAWELYIELVTRIPVMYLNDDQGSLREALTSIYSIFGTTHEILRRRGPSVAMTAPHDENAYSFAYIAIAVLNTTLRPFLAKWHPLLSDYESTRQSGRSQIEHERSWSRSADLRADLRDVERVLTAYADMLGDGAGVPSLIIRPVQEDETQATG